MTIDEAIEQEKFKARVDRIKANKRIFHNNDEDEISACNRSSEEHEQIAEWLEELKALKNGLNIKCDSLNYALEKGKKIGYNEAIDDFVNECIEYEHLTFEQEHIERIQAIAKQLKAGGENG